MQTTDLNIIIPAFIVLLAVKNSLTLKKSLRNRLSQNSVNKIPLFIQTMEDTIICAVVDRESGSPWRGNVCISPHKGPLLGHRAVESALLLAHGGTSWLNRTEVEKTEITDDIGKTEMLKNNLVVYRSYKWSKTSKRSK